MEEKEVMQVDGDKGSGIPGTSHWHKCAILGMSDKPDIAQYIKEVKDKKLNIDGSLDSVKIRAINIIGD